ncbi:MAG: hypothetical protein KC613_18140, partial [Myxococcales bacterium]|nr:hypothetical protein [Myxococcales bacterium]
ERRGKGLSISASLAWEHGTRYVFAAHGQGPAVLAGGRDTSAPFYDFAVGVDGGGDVLTHDDNEFDRIVLGRFRDGWTSARPLALVSMGLGADGGSAPEDFDNIDLPGWCDLGSTSVDRPFADALHRELESLGLWHATPQAWRPDDPYWGYGFKVPQIIALTVRGEFPFSEPGDDPDGVRFPRRRTLKRMSRRLLGEARLYLSEVDR